MKKTFILNRIIALTAACFVTCAGFMSCSMKIEPAPAETIQGTAEEIIEAIDARRVGNYDIIVTGDMTNSLMSQLASSLKSAETSTSRTIDIHSVDFSGATGVTTIQNDAFKGLKKLESIKLPASITNIGYDAFSGTAIKNITLPASVTSISSSTFDNCTSLEAINVAEGSSSFKSIDGVLYNYAETALHVYPIAKHCSDYTVRNGTQYMYANFKETKELATLRIPASVTSIQSSFVGNYNTSIIVNSENTTYSSENGALYLKSPKKLLAWPTASGNIVLNGVSEIKFSCFYENKNITSLTIVSPEGGTVIGSSAFNGCKCLSSISLGNTTEIQYNAFSHCALTNVTIPTSTITIGSGVFYGCRTLSSVNLGSVEQIGDHCFYDCDLRSVTIPTSTESIGLNAFSSNEHLTSVTFADKNGWYVTSNSDYTGGTEISLEDISSSSYNAQNFKSSGSWYNKYLYKSS